MALSQISQLEPGVRALARSLSLAAHIDRPLVRRMRLALFRTRDASIEAELWFCPIVSARDSEAIQFTTSALEELRNEARADGERLNAARAVVVAAHGRAAPTLQLEETVIWLALSGASAEQLDQELGRAVAAMAERPKALARWAAQALQRLPSNARARAPAWALAVGASLQLKTKGLVAGAPPAAAFEWSAQLLSASAPTATVGVRLVSGGIELGPPGAPNAHELQIPATVPRLLELEWGSGGTTHFRHVSLQPDELRLEAGPQGPVRIRTLWGTRFEIRPLAEAPALEATEPTTSGPAEAPEVMAERAPDEPQRRRVRVFVSYARENRLQALRLHVELARFGAVPFADMDAEAGQDWANRRASEIAEADLFFALRSGHQSLVDGEVLVAFAHAQRTGKPRIVPVFLEPRAGDRLPSQMRGISGLSWSDEDEHFWASIERLVSSEGLGSVYEAPTPVESESASEPSELAEPSFLETAELQTWLENRYRLSGEPILAWFLILSLGVQQTWLVSLPNRVLCILDEPETRERDELVQFDVRPADLEPVRVDRGDSTNTGALVMGQHRYLYSLALFPNSAILERGVKLFLAHAAAVGSNPGYHQLVVLALEYDAIRRDQPYSDERTSALVAVRNKMMDPASRIEALDASRLFQMGLDGYRLAALVVVEMTATADLRSHVLEALEKPRSGFEAFHAFWAAGAIFASLAEGERRHLINAGSWALRTDKLDPSGLDKFVPAFFKLASETRSPVYDTFREIEKTLEGHDERNSASYKLILSGDDGGTWFVDLRPSSRGVRQTDEHASSTLSMTDQTFLQLVNGQLTPQTAFTMGKMKVSGDMGLAIKCGQILTPLRRPQPR